MPNPEVRYCTTSDGKQLSYISYGPVGRPAIVVLPAWLWSHEVVWGPSNPGVSMTLEGILGEERRVVSFDRRGVGASDRQAGELSLDIQVDDLARVVDAAGLDRFAIWGMQEGAAVAVGYAVRQPERISSLVLDGAYTRAADASRPTAFAGLIDLIRTDWALARTALAAAVYPEGPPDLQRWLSTGLRDALSPDQAASYFEYEMAIDVNGLLPLVQAPALVIQAHGDPQPLTEARRVAAAIPGARFVVLEESSSEFLRDPRPTVNVIQDFLREQDGVVAPPDPLPPLPPAAQPPPAIDTSPGIRFCTTSDGVSIAYALNGTGPPCVWIDRFVDTLESTWRVSRRLIERYEADFTVVRYDFRGQGMSTGTPEFSIAARLQDLEAVVDALGPDRFILRALSDGCQTAVAYAAKHPERIEKLILIGGYASGPRLRELRKGVNESLISMLHADPALFAAALSSVLGVVAEPVQEYFQADPQARVSTVAALIESLLLNDVSDLLGSVAAPTLVINGLQDKTIPLELGRDLARGLPNASLVTYDDDHIPRNPATVDQVSRAVWRFLKPGRQLQLESEPPSVAFLDEGRASIEDSPPDLTVTRAVRPGAQQQSFASGRYVVQRVLGEGGQKIVYLARDAELERDVAVALVKVEGMAEAGLARLRREARSLARLESHPNIVAIHDIGSHDGRPYTVCEYVAGGTLEKELSRAGGTLPPERAIAITRDVCRALIVAHAADIIHRDIKPSNVWLTAGGSAKLGDFGLATALDLSRVTQSGAVFGTAAYMAPEQALGRQLDARSDIYSLGCVLYEMLAGRPPFQADSAIGVLGQHLNLAPEPLSTLDAGVPKPLEALVLRMLAKAQDDRPSTAAEVLAELEGKGSAAPGAARGSERPAAAPPAIDSTPQIRYATSADGTKIAYEVLGGGEQPPLVEVTYWPVANSGSLASVLVNGLQAGRPYIRYNRRGLHASQRDVDDVSFERQLEDLEAVVEHAGLTQFDMFGLVDGGALCIAYAARHSDRVRKLVFWGAYARAGNADAAARFASVIRTDWGVARQNMSLYIVRGAVTGQWVREAARASADVMSQEVAAKYVEYTPTIDVDTLLPQVKAPVLLFHAKHDPVTPLSAGQSLTAGLQDARLVILEEPDPHVEPDQARMLALMTEFLDGVQPAPAAFAPRQVRYCTTEDGVRIAYTVTGSGPPVIVATDGFISNVQTEWSQAVFRRVYERIAQNCTLIRFDPRGYGMSDRVFASSEEQLLADYDAVVQELGMETFSIAAVQTAVVSAICYAARHPHRVQRIMFGDPIANSQDYIASPRIQALTTTVGADFVVATEMIGAIAFGPGREETVKFGEYIRTCVGPEAFAQLPAIAHIDAMSRLPALTMPSVVVRHDENTFVTAEMARDVVSRLPDGRLAAIPGRWADDPERLGDLVVNFVNEPPPAAPPAAFALPQVRYCTTEDGVRIAYTVTGSGPPLVLRIDQTGSHVEREWSHPVFRSALERIARSHTLITFDPRGVGLSDPVYPAGGDETRRDFDAVLGQLDVDQFDLVGMQTAAIATMDYAATHPDRVRRLILMDPVLRNSDLLTSPQIQAIISAAASDFNLATEMVGVAIFGAGRQEVLAQGDYVRACIRPDYFEYATTTFGDDGTSLLPRLSMRTLVIRHKGVQFVPEASTRELVAGLPDARLVTLPGLWADDTDRLVDHVDAFLSEPDPPARPAIELSRPAPAAFAPPHVRYCTTEDGVRIAYTVTGEGPPLIYLNDPMGSHVQLEWSFPVTRQLYELLARKVTLVRLDPRGVGMSDRVLPAILEDALPDVNAVADRLGLQQFSLASAHSAVNIGVPYAVHFGQRVQRLILVNGYIRNADLIATPQAQALLGASAGNFELATELLGAMVFGGGREESLDFGAFIRACIGPEIMTHPPILGFDLTDYVSQVQTPTLVIRRDGMQVVTEEMTRELVARLPDARLAIIPGLNADNLERVADEIVAFVNEEEP